MAKSTIIIYIYIKQDLVGGDWNHGIYDFPLKVGNGQIIPTDELTPSFFRGVGGSTTVFVKSVANDFPNGKSTSHWGIFLLEQFRGWEVWLDRVFFCFRKWFSNPKNCMFFPKSSINWV
jgi:hypothetical protein